MRSNQLLLLAQRAHEAESVRPEAEHRDQRQHHQRLHRSARDPSPPPPVPRGEDHKRKREPSRGLHAHAYGHQLRRRAQRVGPIPPKPIPSFPPIPHHRRTPPGCHRKRARRHEQHQSVVVRACGRQLQQHRIEPHEDRRRPRRATHAARRQREEPNRAQARAHRNSLQSPKPPRQAQRRDRIGAEREQRPIRRMLKRPTDERKARVRWSFRGHMRVWIEAVQRPQPPERQIAEHVLGKQRRPHQHERVGEHDRDPDRPAREPVRAHQHRRIARAHRQRPRLKARGGDPHAQPVQRPRQPPRPTAAAPRNVGRGRPRRARHHAKHARHHADQAERRERRLEALAPASMRATVRHDRYAFHVFVLCEHLPPCARAGLTVHRAGRA